MPRQRPLEALVLHYSQTGNTAKLAEAAGQALSDRGWKTRIMSFRSPEETRSLNTPDLLVLGTPTHFWKPPVMAVSRIRALPRFVGSYAFVYTTYGGVFASDSALVLAREAEALGARVLGGASVYCPHNFMTGDGRRLGDVYPEFGLDQPNPEAMADFLGALESVARTLEAGPAGGFDLARLGSSRKMLSFLDSLVPLSVKRDFLPLPRVDAEACKQCRMCLSVCDTGAVRFVREEIVTNAGTCMRCYQCVRACPQGARVTDWAKIEKLLRGVKKLMSPPVTRTAAVDAPTEGSEP
ncbi:MAG: 4Fe-4S binding protein [Proteobacteria bacterium]|nr:4Fe-4S binding protein [Pseudomonadota bacterium]